MTTVGVLLSEATDRLRQTQSESPRLDAELLLGFVLGVERSSLLAWPQAPVSDGQVGIVRVLVDRRAAGEPVAYIRGLKEFHGIAFSVDRRVLIPRPETETLVDLVLEAVRRRLAAAPRPEGTPPLRLWDVGTGSGAIAVALAVALRRLRSLEHVQLCMSDVSRDALALALENAVAHGVADRVDAAVGDLFHVEPLPQLPVDLVVANLPYVPTGTLPSLPVAVSFEPVLALDGGADGLRLVDRLLSSLAAVLADDGLAFLEIGSEQAEAAMASAERRLPDGWTSRIHADLTGRPRVLEVRPPAA